MKTTVVDNSAVKGSDVVNKTTSQNPTIGTTKEKEK